MTEADTALLQHVPEPIRDSCSPGAAVTPAIASLDCFTDLETGIFVYYTSYPDLNSMNTAYQSYVLVYGNNPGSKTCEKADNWPAQGPWSVNESEEDAGQLLCSGFGDAPAMFWTDERLNILSWSWGLTDVTRDDMWSFWTTDAGPIE